VTQSGVVTTLAGSTQSYADGTGTAAQFNMPYNVVKDLQGNFLITDHYNNRIRKMTPAGVVTTFAGSGAWDSMDGDLLTASIYKPTDIAINASGNIYLCDGNSKIRWITPEGKVRTINTNISFNGPQGIVADNNDVIYISDYYNNRICKVTYQ
jgi:streptogramin lyase